jgi:hypothetical protein
LKESKERMDASKSEVARLLRQIDLEYQAAHLGLTGLASGTSQHQVITARMEHMGESFTTLIDLVGSPEAAIKMVADTLEHLPNTPTQCTLVDLLQRELDHTEESAILIEHIQEMWKTMNLLAERFGLDVARKMIDAPEMMR